MTLIQCKKFSFNLRKLLCMYEQLQCVTQNNTLIMVHCLLELFGIFTFELQFNCNFFSFAYFLAMSLSCFQLHIGVEQNALSTNNYLFQTIRMQNNKSIWHKSKQQHKYLEHTYQTYIDMITCHQSKHHCKIHNIFITMNKILLAY